MKKIGIVMTLILFTFTLSAIFGQNLKRTYRNIIEKGIRRTSELPADTIQKEDLSHLPPLLQNYLENVGVIGQARVNNVKIEFKGRMRSNPGDQWMYFTSEQYNFFDEPTRAFYIRAKKAGLPANGLHLYQDNLAYMKIKLAGLFKIIDADGPEMDRSETVTFLNDMCFFAPAVLVDMDIVWEELADNRLKATYSNGKHKVSAELVFTEEGQLINFISNDRYEIQGKEAHLRPWFTPVEETGRFGKFRLPSKAGAWYKRPDGDFCYGEFTTINVEYNCREADF